MVARLGATVIDIDPGTPRTVDLVIANTGTIVEGYRFEPLGDVAGFVSVAPPEIQVYPGEDATVTVTIAVPRESTAGYGEVPLAIRVRAQEQPTDSQVPEALLRIRRFGELLAELSPRTLHSRGRARTQLAVDNPGNAPVAVLIEPVATDGQLVVDVADPDVTVEPGHAAFVDVALKPAKVPWTGAAKTLPFAVTLREPRATAPLRVDGTLVVEARIPRWLPRLLLALLALLIALLLFWFLLIRPAVSRAAKSAAAPAVEQAGAAEQKAVAAQQAASAMAGQVQQAEAAAASAEKKADDAVAAVNSVLITVQDGKVIVGSTATSPFSTRISLTDAVGGKVGAPASFPAPDGGRIDVSDIVFQNPFGASGVLRVTAGDRELYTLSLDNFRDLDYHYVTPIRVETGEALTGTVECTAAGTSTTGCQIGVTIGGTLAEPVTPAPSVTP